MPSSSQVRSEILTLTRNATLSATALRELTEDALGRCPYFYTELRAIITEGLLEEVPIEGGGFKVTAAPKGVGV